MVDLMGPSVIPGFQTHRKIMNELSIDVHHATLSGQPLSYVHILTLKGICLRKP